MKLKQINEAYPTIAKIAEVSLTKLGLNYQDGKKFIEFCKKFKEEFQVYSRRHKELLESVGFESQENGTYQLKEENPEKREAKMCDYYKQKKELDENDVNIDCDVSIRGSALLDLSANDNLILECFFNIQEEE